MPKFSNEEIELFDEIIGFDLGDAESALTKVNIVNSIKKGNIPNNKKESDLIPINIMREKGSTSFITAIGYDYNGNIFIGNETFDNDQIKESKVNFKQRPDKDPKYRRMMKDFIGTVIYKMDKAQGIDKNNRKSEKRLYVIGCPNKWTADNDERIRTIAYYLTVLDPFRIYMHHGALIISVGPCVTEFTLIDDKDELIYEESGCNLGTNTIDLAILSYILDRDPRKQEIMSVFKLRPHIRNEALVCCKRAREQYISSCNLPTECRRGFQVIEITEEIFIEIHINEEIMDTILKSELVELGKETDNCNSTKVSWPAAFEQEIKQLKDELKIKPGVILLADQFSSLPFILDTCRSVFPDTRICCPEAYPNDISESEINASSSWKRNKDNYSFAKELVKRNPSKTVQLYEKIASKAGARPVMVVAESMAACYKVSEDANYDIIISDLKKPVLVIDVGSSTIDFTLVDLSNKDSITIDNSGCELGARLIDHAIFKYVLDRSREKKDILKEFELKPRLKTDFLLGCRQAKEEYFSQHEKSPENRKGFRVKDINGEIFIRILVNEEMMSNILESELVELGSAPKLDETVDEYVFTNCNEYWQVDNEKTYSSTSTKVSWPAAFEQEIKRIKEKLNLVPGIVILTGGASRMYFIRDICESVFPPSSIRIIMDDFPELTISDGLTRFGRYYVRFERFSRDVNRYLEEDLNRDIRALIPTYIDTICDNIASLIIKKAMIPEIKDYLHYGYSQDTMNDWINRKVQDVLKSPEIIDLNDKEFIKISSQITNSTNKMMNELSKKYGMPAGTLNMQDIPIKDIPHNIDFSSFANNILSKYYDPSRASLESKLVRWFGWLGYKKDKSFIYHEDDLLKSLEGEKANIAKDLKASSFKDRQLLEDITKNIENRVREKVIDHAQSAFLKIGGGFHYAKY